MEVYGVQWKYKDDDDSRYDCKGTMGDLFANRDDAERLLKDECDKVYKRHKDDRIDDDDPITMETDKMTSITTIDTGCGKHQYWVQSFNLNLKTKGA